MTIPTSVRLAETIGARTFRMVCKATITRGKTVLAADLPVDIGREEGDASLRVPTRITLQLPRVIDGQDWTGDGIDSPIAPYGQRVHVKIGVDVGPDGYEWINRGEFLIYDSDVSGPTVTIQAANLLYLVDEARMVSAYKPLGKSTFAAIRKLIEPALTVVKHPNYVDRTIGFEGTYDDDRLGAALALADSASARMVVTPSGVLRLQRRDVLLGDTGGTGMDLQRYHDPSRPLNRPNLIEVTPVAKRDNLYNSVVVVGENSTGAPVMATAYDRRGGPSAYGGPFNPLPVPLVVRRDFPTAAIGKAVAGVHLQFGIPPYRRQWSMRAVPNPRIELQDKLLYLPADGYDGLVAVEVREMTLPYTARSGAMTLLCREVPPT